MTLESLNFVQVRCSICHTLWVVDEKSVSEPYICPLCHDEMKGDNTMSELVSCNNKEVYFDQYCSSCKYFEQPESDEPCNTCLAYPMNECSHRPVYWKAKD